MKFTVALSVALLACSVSAASVAREPFGNRKGGNKGGFTGNKGGNNGANKGGNAASGNKGGNAASSSSSASSAASTSASGNANSGNAQTSLTLLSSVIASGFAQNGLAANGSEAGEVASLTSTNNFINFCATTNLPITNGQQIITGSCNPAPMGVIAAQTNMPASKFVFPTNFANIAAANTAFTITMNIKNLETGNFVNAKSNYYAAPQQVNAQGNIIGHSHFVVEQLQSFTQTTPLDNTKFAFFQGVNTPADGNGNLNVQVAKGLPAGFYRVASINAAANHQPALVAVAQHGSLDDMVYFSVGNVGNGGVSGATGSASNASSSSTTAASSANTGKAASNGKGGNAAGSGAATGSKGNTGKGGKGNGRGKGFKGFARSGLSRL